jgi:orotate phosphoribosyltransferase
VTRQDIEELHRLMQFCLKREGPYTLASGLTSNYYYDGKLGTLHPPTVWLAANALVDVILAAGEVSASAVVANVVAAVNTFVGEAEPADDMTLLAVRRSP